MNNKLLLKIKKMHVQNRQIKTLKVFRKIDFFVYFIFIVSTNYKLLFQTITDLGKNCFVLKTPKQIKN